MPIVSDVFDYTSGTAPGPAGAAISSAKRTQRDEDLKAALNTTVSVARGGTGVTTAIGARAALDVLSGLKGLGTVGGTANAITLTTGDSNASLADGLIVSFKATDPNTAATTINVDGLGAKAIRAPGDTALAGGEIKADAVYLLRYHTAYNSSAGAWEILNREPTPDFTKLTLGTYQNTTSGTSVDFTGIPAGVVRVTINLAGVSTNGSSYVTIRLGTGSGIIATGYSGASTVNSGTSISTSNHTTGLAIRFGLASAPRHGHVVLELAEASTNTWIMTSVVGIGNAAAVATSASRVTLTDPLTQFRITTENGTDTLNGGYANYTAE